MYLEKVEFFGFLHDCCRLIDVLFQLYLSIASLTLLYEQFYTRKSTYVTKGPFPQQKGLKSLMIQ